MIVRFTKRGVFDPDATAAMSKAFDAACKELYDAGEPEIALEVMAERIIEAAKAGEFDPVRLRQVALVGVKRTSD